MSFTPMTTLAAETAGVPEINPYLVGGLILAFLLVVMLALTVFGKGRDHS